MSQIHYVIGDATDPLSTGPRVLAHGCNDVGAWGAGFTRALSNRWPHVENEYDRLIRALPRSERGGKVADLVQVETTLWVAHIVTQQGLIDRHNPTPVKYDWIERGLNTLGRIAPNLAPTEQVTIHMPRIGCGLGGGKWEMVEPLVQKYLCGAGLDVYVYDLP
jgi:O-acetyl-ADP-ribose deacetylase (regulator of RNase III)